MVGSGTSPVSNSFFGTLIFEGDPLSTKADINFPWGSMKKSSLPSPRQRGWTPPARETCLMWSNEGKEATKTSHLPVRFSPQAISRPSGDKWNSSFMKLDEYSGLGLLSPLTEIVDKVFVSCVKR